MSSFNSFPITPDSVFQTIKELGVRIMRDQSEYSRLVERIYESDPPLKAGRPKTNDTFSQEIGVIGDIIAHCLIIGDSKLLHDFVIDPIKDDLAKGSLTLLTFPDSLENYACALKDLAERSGTETGKIYWSLVINTFTDAANRVQSGYVTIE